MTSEPDRALGAMSAQLKAKTGRDLEAWIALARASGHARHKALLDHLKGEHGLTHGYANTITLKALATDAGSIGEDELMRAMFAGPKAAMRPVYDAVMALVDALGGDVGLAPKKGYVSVRRRKQFALVQPSTKDRLDLGLNLKGAPPAGRLEASGSFNAMVSHRVRLAAPAEVDGEVAAWIRQAYEAAG